MRNLNSALAVGIVLTPLSVSAAIITENFTLTIPSTTVSSENTFDSTPVAQFDAAEGTLNEIMATLTGAGTLTINPGSLGLTALLLTPSRTPIPGADQSFSSSGTINFNLSGSDSSGSDLASLVGTGTASLILQFISPQGSSTIATTTPTGLQGTITYDFTPAVAVPEPAPLALLSAGLVGFAVIRRRSRLETLRQTL